MPSSKTTTTEASHSAIYIFDKVERHENQKTTKNMNDNVDMDRVRNQNSNSNSSLASQGSFFSNIQGRGVGFDSPAM